MGEDHALITEEQWRTESLAELKARAKSDTDPWAGQRAARAALLHRSMASTLPEYNHAEMVSILKQKGNEKHVSILEDGFNG